MTRDPMHLAGLALMLLVLGVLAYEVAVLATVVVALVLVDDDEVDDVLEDGTGVDRC
ncbi:hypothetical protein [Nocardiopsis sp. NPDC057823]|uniref:hypothetical protein n=1 Tax=Nocardiopsis sp. NPDC057823 TaxID=3346256 RepID=UPI003672DEC4